MRSTRWKDMLKLLASKSHSHTNLQEEEHNSKSIRFLLPSFCYDRHFHSYSSNHKFQQMPLLDSFKNFLHITKKDKMAPPATPSATQAEVILVGCGCPLRGMGWYHAVQMLGDEVPHAKLCHVVEPWFLGAGTYSIVILFCSLLSVVYDDMVGQGINRIH